MKHQNPMTRISRSPWRTSALLLLSAGFLGCGAGPLPPLHPTVHLAHLEQFQGRRMTGRQDPGAACEAAAAYERSAALYQQARWPRRQQRVAALAQQARQLCPGGAPMAVAEAPAAPAATAASASAPPAPTPVRAEIAMSVTAQQARPAQPAQPQAPQVVVAAPAPPVPPEAPAAAPAPAVAQASAATPPQVGGTSEAQPPADASAAFTQHVEQARAMFAEGRYDEVLRHLIAAWQIRQEPTVLFNAAICYEYLHQYPAALQIYRQLATHPQLGAMANERIAILDQQSAAPAIAP